MGAEPDTFLHEVWTRRPLLTRAADRGTGPAEDRFADLLSPRDVDEIAALRGLRHPFFRVVRDGSTLRGMTRSGVAGGERVTDLADPDRLREAYADGATLALQALHRTHPPLLRFCRELAAELGHPAQANAYITPPGARGFAAHHDTHDVFVLQLDGTKQWHVHAPVLVDPLPSQPSSDLVGPDGRLLPDDAEPLLSAVLHPGDALYVPRGFPHAAETNEDRSLHLTIGVLGVTRHDVLLDLLRTAGESARDDPALRRLLPVAALRDDRTREAEAEAVLAALQAWVAGLAPDDVLPVLDHRLSSAVPIEPVGMLAADGAVRSLTPGSTVRLRQGLAPALGDAGTGDGRVTLLLPDRTVDLPASTRTALQRLLDGAPARIADLADDGLDAADCVVLVRRLLREGVLTPVPGDQP